MRKIILRIIVLALLVTVAGLSGSLITPAEGATVPLEIWNNTGHTATELYVSMINASDWGSNRLPRNLPSGQRIRVNLRPGLRYDIRLVDTDGDTYTFRMTTPHQRGGGVRMDPGYRVARAPNRGNTPTPTPAARRRPDWVSWSWDAQFVRNQNENNLNSPNYWLIRFDVTYTNNSRDRDITALYNVDVRFSGITTTHSAWPASIRHVNVNHSSNFSAVVNVDVWPGLTLQRSYQFYLRSLVSANQNDWRGINTRISERSATPRDLFDNRSLSLDFNVRSRRNE